MIAAVNGEPCQCLEDSEVEDFASVLHEEHPEGLMGKITGHVTCGLLEYHHMCEGLKSDGYGCDCEKRDFSWSPCDGCGSNLGGDRHAFTIWL